MINCEFKWGLGNLEYVYCVCVSSYEFVLLLHVFVVRFHFIMYFEIN